MGTWMVAPRICASERSLLHAHRKRTVDLVLGEALNVNDELLAVDTDDLAVGVLVSATDNGDLISLADRKRADAVLLPEILRQGGAHEGAAGAGGSREVSLAALSARGADVCKAIRKDREALEEGGYSPLLYFIAAP